MADAPQDQALPLASLSASRRISRAGETQEDALTDPRKKTDSEKLAEDLEKLKVKIIPSMVSTVEYNIGDSMQSSHLIYFTNQQAFGVSQQQMPSVRKALRIREPKLVIRLLPSTGQIYWEARKNVHLASGGSAAPPKRPPEIPGQALDVEHRLLLLAKEVLLPLAFRASALIIGSSLCSITNAFARASAPIQRRLGEDCPFRVVIWDHAPWLWKSASSEGNGLSKQAWKTSDAWQRADFRKCMQSMHGSDPSLWPQKNLVEGAAAYLIFESMEPDGLPDPRPGEQFMNRFVASLQSHLPVVALWTHGKGSLNTLSQAADHVSYGLPLVLLDSRSNWKFPDDIVDEEEEVPPSADDGIEAADAPVAARAQKNCLDCELTKVQRRLEHICEALAEESLVDTYSASALACIRCALDRGQAEKQMAESYLEIRNKPYDQLWLGEAIDKARLQTNTCSSDRDVSTMKAVEMFLRYAGKQQRLEARIFRDMLEEGIAAILDSQDFQSLEANWLLNRHKLQWAIGFNPSCLFKRTVNGIPLACFQGTPEEAGIFTSEVLVNVKELQEGATLEEVLESIQEACDELAAINAAHDEKYMHEELFCHNQRLWLATRNILTSSSVFVSGIDHVEQIRTLLNEQAKTDRLPAHNTLQGLLLLRSAWNLYDLFAGVALKYKRLTKLSYVLVMVLGVVVIFISCFESVGSLEAETSKLSVLSLALATGAIQTWTSVTDPSNKWRKLRSGSVILQAEIWKYRTRIGNYAIAHVSQDPTQGDRLAEQSLHKAIRTVRESVLESSGLSQTSFYASTALCMEDAEDAPGPKAHKQYPGSKEEIPTAGDNHHSPANPEEYIRWRIEPMLRFYQSRVPIYSRVLIFLHVISIGSSILTAVLALANLNSWTPLVVAVSSSFAAWEEFAATGKKLQRYAAAIDTLSSLIMWWQSLTSVDEADTRNIEHLVNTAEATLASEHTAWMSDALKAQQMVEESLQKHRGVGEEGLRLKKAINQDDG
ncbi:unnamed protein product [Effrenium voratum]|nr:unnamed protein product [Effrenium voratum]